ncbi:MAG: PAS domain S-box protein [Desulfobacterales bacterium]|nr:PAS domain S-box protein [Desulfobacterales bacterium]
MLKSTLIGGRRRVLAVVRDMDERKRIQEALRQKEEYYRSLFDDAMDIVTIMRPDGTILFESPSVERIVGYKPEELVGLNAFALIDPEDAKSLGLTIVRPLAKQLGGTVDVQRASEARFHVTFANKP